MGSVGLGVRSFDGGVVVLRCLLELDGSQDGC